ncbi:MAG: HigA family addiction module antidote protein [Erysipelotrichaceae bacterium]|nr:HigA family addiction module antidote protein [Erysipelotrichaceae bacterium]
MAVNRRGISLDLLIHPGETIKDVLEERSISQKELSKRAGVSEPFISDVILGKKDISKTLAIGLEYALNIPSSFWLNLQANYDAQLLICKENESITEEEIYALDSLKDIIAFFVKADLIPKRLTKNEKVISLRKVLHISNLGDLNKLIPEGSFRIKDDSSIDPITLGAWVCMCKNKTVDGSSSEAFDPDAIPFLIKELKQSMFLRPEDLQAELPKLLSRYGIRLSLMPHFRGVPVQGYITKNGSRSYDMFLTNRRKSADIIWFSLFHELGHIVNGDLKRNESYLDPDQRSDNDMEKKADRFASSALLDPEAFRIFLEREDYSLDAIEEFAEQQNVPSFIVIGRLQKEGILKWEYYHEHKPKYEWN